MLAQTFSQKREKHDLGLISDDSARVAHSEREIQHHDVLQQKSASSLASNMKKNVCAREVTNMKFQCRQVKSKAIMKGTYRLSCSSHPTPKNQWEFPEKGQLRRQLSGSLIDVISTLWFLVYTEKQTTRPFLYSLYPDPSLFVNRWKRL